jgi:hypothetical protein
MQPIKSLRERAENEFRLTYGKLPTLGELEQYMRFYKYSKKRYKENRQDN